MKSYVIWANKGGIGKSTLTFQLACAAARANPQKKILVIDLSPQCDVSRMILGGGHGGGESAIISLMQTTPRKTIQAYLMDCLNDIPSGIGWPNPKNYIIKPNSVRRPGTQNIPDNLELICGDFDLERVIQIIEQLPQPPRRSGRAPTGPEYSTYLLARSFIRYLVENIENANKNEDYIVFIDTDPYFNVITTHMGLVAADKWISAYSPNSQASQFAVLRSVEFMFDSFSGLARFIADEQARFPAPWYDNRGKSLTAPHLKVADACLLIANMATPFKRSGGQSYNDPQRLHRQTIQAVNSDVATEFARHSVTMFPNLEHMWDMRRLGLICDYNGVELESLVLGNNYPEPGSVKQYYLNATGGTPNQLSGYVRRLNHIASIL